MALFGNAIFVWKCNERYMDVRQFLLSNSIFVCAITHVSFSEV